MATRPDSAAVAALDADYIKPAFLCYLDIVGDPLYATTWPANLTFAADYPDEDMAGKTFLALKPELINISEVKYQEGGAETVTATLSGLILPDNNLLNILNNRANWWNRPARLWQAVYDETDVQRGAFWNYYTGRMVGMPISLDPNHQVIELVIESYLSSTTGASNRTLLDQADFDEQDRSAEAAIALANGTGGVGLAGGGGYGAGLSDFVNGGGAGGLASALMRRMF